LRVPAGAAAAFAGAAAAATFAPDIPATGGSLATGGKLARLRPAQAPPWPVTDVNRLCYRAAAMFVFLLILHGVSAVLLLGAITHQALAAWWPAARRDGRWWNALRAVHAERYTGAIAALLPTSSRGARRARAGHASRSPPGSRSRPGGTWWSATS
jgi:hypothetical protein